MTTAIQDLIKDFTELSKKEGDSGFVGRSVLSIINNKKYAEKEKEQISDAWLDGYCANENDVIDSTNYFDTKFGHDIV
jgi:hypothetical protein